MLFIEFLVRAIIEVMYFAGAKTIDGQVIRVKANTRLIFDTGKWLIGEGLPSPSQSGLPKCRGKLS